MRQTDRALPIALLRAREATLRPFRAHLDAHGLTAQQWRVIRSLCETGPMTASELSQRCVLMPPSLSRILRALTDRGLVTRIAPEARGDARRKPVRLSDAGEALFRSMSGRSEEIHAEIETAFGRERMDALLDLLIELRHAVEGPEGDMARVDARELDT